MCNTLLYLVEKVHEGRAPVAQPDPSIGRQAGIDGDKDRQVAAYVPRMRDPSTTTGGERDQRQLSTFHAVPGTAFGLRSYRVLWCVRKAKEHVCSNLIEHGSWRVRFSSTCVGSILVISFSFQGLI